MVRVNFPLPKASVMSDQTPLLSLPLIQAAQAQKHVTHNEAIEQLDMIVQLTVEAVNATTPPSGATEGQAWAVGTGATGAWAGRAGQIAAWRGNGWLFAIPQTGWRAWDKTAGALIAFDGAGWITAGGGSGSDANFDSQNLDGLGINTTSDTTNKLAVSSDATLLNHNGTGHQLKINKSDATDTASLLYQTNFSGRAEMGLNGNDDFSVKVSADGSNFTEAMRIDGATGTVKMPVTGTRQLMPYQYRQFLYANRAWAAPFPDASQHAASSQLGTGSEPTVNWATRGIFLPAGTNLHQLTLAGYINNAEVAGIDLRIYFQTGEWDGTWDSEAQTTRHTLFSQNGDTSFFGPFVMLRQTYPLSHITADDGVLFVAARPSSASTLTSTRYFYIGGALDATLPPSA